MAKTFTDEQRNSIIEISELYITQLSKLREKITKRNTDFVSSNGDKKGKMKQRLGTLSDNELKTRLIIMSKILCEIVNLESSLRIKLKIIDKEIAKRE